MSGRLQLYDKTQIEKNNLLFDNKALAALLFPLIIEQLLNSFMGMADTMMVSNVGSAAISAVSLVDSVNMLVIQVFSALATGAAIICSQYIGSRNIKECNNAARQVVLSVAVISVSLMIIGIIFRYPLLRLIFGNVEADVMDNSLVYFLITVCSYPFLALFNVGAAFFRADGNARYPMIILLILLEMRFLYLDCQWGLQGQLYRLLYQGYSAWWLYSVRLENLNRRLSLMIF